MANEVVGNLPLPGYRSVGSFTDDEVLASMMGYFQKGVTVLGGQGIIPKGCILGRVTASKKYKVYNVANTDGTQTARCVLRHSVDTGTGVTAADTLANVLYAGRLKYNSISGMSAGALTDLAGRIDSVNNLFIF
jgi:hypothetical protein